VVAKVLALGTKLVAYAATAGETALRRSMMRRARGANRLNFQQGELAMSVLL
jgi:hypothetical protein